MDSVPLISRVCRRAWFRGLSTSAGLLAWILVPASVSAQTDADSKPFQWKPSGFENLVGASSTTGRDGGAGGSTESEVEFTPQYKTESGTVFAIRGVVNLFAASNVTGISSAWSFTVPELSVFSIGDFGRIEFGDRAGFPQSLIGFTPSEIAFTAGEFGPESGVRLDPNGGLPTTFLPHALADRINGLTYLGYAARSYDDRSLKLIYLTPRTVSGFYGAVSYTPANNISRGFDLASNTKTPAGGLEDEGDRGVFHNIVQAAAVYEHRTDTISLSTGLTLSHATGTSSNSGSPLTARDSDSLSAGVSLTLEDTWTVGLSGTYDGFSRYDMRSGFNSSPVRPFGAVASLNYVNGPWVVGGYYQHATADSITAQPGRDNVDVFELGVSYLIDQTHDLLGMGRYTDVKLFGSVYYYNFRGAATSEGRGGGGEVFLIGCRFSFF
jgi:hypothetical protein